MGEPKPKPKRSAGRVARWRAWGAVMAGQVRGAGAEARALFPPFDVGAEIYERDRDAFGAVLGSAIALRVFLFTVSLMVMVTAFDDLVTGGKGLRWGLSSSGITGDMAKQVESASTGSTGRSIWLLLVGIFLTAEAGRVLARVLAASSAGAWRLDGRAARTPIRIIVRVTGLTILLVAAAGVVNRVRAQGGLALATGALVMDVAVLGMGWFMVSLTLPRSTRDPGAVLPGAALFGVTMAVVHWFMHYWFPHRVEHASRIMGSAGATVAALGYLFIIGRVMAFSLSVNAVIFARYGSISDVVFGLPLLNRLPKRSPKLAEFFDLTVTHPAAGAAGGDGDGDPVSAPG